MTTIFFNNMLTGLEILSSKELAYAIPGSFGFERFTGKLFEIIESGI